MMTGKDKLEETLAINIDSTIELIVKQVKEECLTKREFDGYVSIERTEPIMGQDVTIKATRSPNIVQKCRSTFYLNGRRVPRHALTPLIIQKSYGNRF